MKIKRMAVCAAVILAAVSGCSAADCEEWKDNLLGAFNGVVEFVGRCALTNDLWLKGSRTMGSDDYNGSYAAEYARYSGEEYLFGGTSLYRENKSMKVTYTLELQSGSACLYRIDGENEYEIAGESAEGVYEFSVNVGDNFIVLKGENFTGSLSLTVES